LWRKLKQGGSSLNKQIVFIMFSYMIVLTRAVANLVLYNRNEHYVSQGIANDIEYVDKKMADRLARTI
jgi:hypothetical protein